MNGYILLHKKVINSDIWNKPPLYFKVFMFLLIKAQYQECNGLERGQVLTSISEIQEACSYYVGYRKETPTKRQIRDIIDYLKTPVTKGNTKGNTKGDTKGDTNSPMIVTANVTQGIVVTICNYNIYQDSNFYERHNERAHEEAHERSHERSHEETANEFLHYIEKNKEIKNKEKKNIYNPPFIPPTVEEVGEYCRERKNNIDPEAFIDFYQTRGWVTGKVKMKDWKAAVRTWERKDKENGNHNGNTKRTGKYDHIGTWL